jgi:hypothetical protein
MRLNRADSSNRLQRGVILVKVADQPSEGDEGCQTLGMSETYTTCPICDRSIDPGQPDAVLAEKVDDHAGFRAHDLTWTPAGYAHQECLAGANGFRAAAEPMYSHSPAGGESRSSTDPQPAFFRPRRHN